ncbi:MAG: deoxyguanosinetriphosphate triphosphohydrolase [Planctomycetes bacterium]|nr:deoxyguanosinetriphosphate triphosphohydrolase [Planctomycetota bacterium]
MSERRSGPVERAEIEEREARNLRGYGMRSAESRGRVLPQEPDPWRTDFQRDRDRIIHCSAFRRLDNKTQVFVSPKGKHYRTRLTHSLEVGQIARSLARILGLNEDLSEAVALAHDLGHTPFGHSGGDVLERLMADHGGFEHNLQSLRIVTFLEDRYPGGQGLNLTYEVRESILKHNRPFAGEAFRDYHPEEGPLLEAQLVDICDGIAYNSHDIDDGLSAGILVPEELAELALMKEVSRFVDDRWPGLDATLKRRKVISEIINYLITDLVAQSSLNLDALGIENVADLRRLELPVLGFSERVRNQDAELRRFLYDKLYTHYRVHQMRNRAKVFIEGLFTAFCDNPKLMPPKYQGRIASEGLHRSVADYIAGMTDSYAQEEYQRLFNPFESGA